MQLVFGYLLGRIVISLLFIPSYFRGELMTVYQLLERRFGNRIKMLAASLFVVMRNIADGIRLLLTAFVLAAVYTAFQPQANAETIVILSVILLGVVMIIFTYFGGMEAVIWVEVVQLGIYIAGAAMAGVVLLMAIKGGWGQAVSLGEQYHKFNIHRLRNQAHDLTRSRALYGSHASISRCRLTSRKRTRSGPACSAAAFLTMSTHGTDQYLVQRYLCTDKPRRAALALLTSGAVVFAQFRRFLVHRRAVVCVLRAANRSGRTQRWPTVWRRFRVGAELFRR